MAEQPAEQPVQLSTLKEVFPGFPEEFLEKALNDFDSDAVTVYLYNLLEDRSKNPVKFLQTLYPQYDTNVC